MSEARVSVLVDGRELEVAGGISVAAALMNARLPLRTSVRGQARSALCGMGVCYECRVTIDGRPFQRACMATVAAGMRIDRDG